MNTTRFAAPWDGTVKTITALFVGLLSGIALLCLVLGIWLIPRSLSTGVVMFVVASLCLVILALAVAGAPRGYLLGPEGVVILRRRSRITMPAAEIASAEIDASGEVCRKAIRLGGMGGAFGFWGEFAKDGFGPYEAYATRRTGLVIVRRVRGEPVVITPEDPERFVALLRQYAASAPDR